MTRMFLIAGGIVLFMGLAILIGIQENRANDPLIGCTQFDTGTSYTGYHCLDGDKFTN